jgi:hypothetical protein
MNPLPAESSAKSAKDPPQVVGKRPNHLGRASRFG